MSLKSKIENEIKQAMLNKDKDRLRALRAIKSQILLAETDKGSHGELTEEIELKILQKASKQRKDSVEIYKQQGRDDLAVVEIQEIKVIEEFLPAQISVEELKSILEEIINQVGASGPQDMGKVMGMASKELAGRADGKSISTKVRELLA